MNSQLAIVFAEALKLSNDDLQALVTMLQGVIQRTNTQTQPVQAKEPSTERSKQPVRQERSERKQPKWKESENRSKGKPESNPDDSDSNVKHEVKPRGLASKSPVPSQPVKRNPLNSVYLHFQCAYDFITGDVSVLSKRNSSFVRSNAEKVKKNIDGLRKLADEGVDGYRKWVSESEGGKHQLLMNDPTENFGQALQQVVDWATTSVGSIAPENDEK